MMKNWIWLIGAFVVTLPGIFFRLINLHEDPILATCFSGITIVGASFLLCWASEVAEKDISRNLAIAFLALVAVLPEYAVDLYFAWKSGKDPNYIQFATANMTGANRLLIGFGWPLLVFLNYIKRRERSISLDKPLSVEITFLLFATIYSFIIPLRGTLNLFDFLLLSFLFIFYMISASGAEQIECETMGPPEIICRLPDTKRKIVTISLFLYCAFSILVSAEPFAEGLISSGRILGIEEFILVQWLAPLASESPEILTMSILVLKNRASVGMSALISSKVNQWTLLISMIPLIFVISKGGISPMHLDARQTEEILLTSAQSFFGIAVLCNLSFSLREALILSFLFFSQLFFIDPTIRYIYSGLYMFLGIFLLLTKKGSQLKSLSAIIGYTFKGK